MAENSSRSNPESSPLNRLRALEERFEERVAEQQRQFAERETQFAEEVAEKQRQFAEQQRQVEEKLRELDKLRELYPSDIATSLGESSRRDANTQEDMVSLFAGMSNGLRNSRLKELTTLNLKGGSGHSQI